MIVDKNVTLQIIGSLMKQPMLLAEVDKYNLTPKDFSSTIDKYIFAAIANLQNNGAESLSVVDIDNYLSNHEVGYNIFTKNNGIEYLNDAEMLSNPSNFNYYYTKLKKINALNELKAAGFDISNIYPENNLLLNDDIDSRLEKFEKMSVKDIFDSIKTNFIEIEDKFSNDSEKVTIKANSNIERLLTSLEEKPEVGANLQGEIFNTISRGGRRGKYYIRSAQSGTGKALYNEELIATSRGWKKVKEVVKGDFLYDRNGLLTEVMGVYPQKVKRKVFIIKFLSGRSIKCDKEHLWRTIVGEERKKSFERVVTTKQLQNRMNIYPFVKKDNAERYRFPVHGVAIPVAESITGIINGNFKEIFETSKLFCEAFERQEYFNLKSCIYVREEYRKKLFAEICSKLADLDEDGEFFISCDNEKILQEIQMVSFSLGIYAMLYKKENKNYLKIYLTMNDKNGFFIGNRKIIQKYTDFSISHPNYQPRENNISYDPILEIIETDEQEFMTCFYVNNSSHLFLATNTLIVTHNTRSMIGDACYLAYPIRYDNKINKWVKTGCGNEKVLFIGSEQSPDELQTMIVAYLSGINEEDILFGRLSEEEKRRRDKAVIIMKKYEDNFILVQLPNPSIAQIQSTIRKHCLIDKVTNVLYDYIFSSSALLNEFKGLGLREDVLLSFMSRALKDLAVELDVFIMTATQTNRLNDEQKGVRNQNVLRGSTAIAEKADLGCIMSKVTSEESKSLTLLAQKIGVMPNQVLDIYKLRRGKYSNVRIWSNVDLGTCRKEDLFITDGEFNEITDFKIRKIIFNFEKEQEKDIYELLNLLNETESSLENITKEETKEDIFKNYLEF